MQLIPAALGGTGTLSTALTVAGTVMSGVAGLQQGNYQAAVAMRNAAIQEENANRAIMEAGQNAQMKDEEALAQLGAMLAAGGASGLSLGVGSMALRRRSAEELASRDRQIIMNEGATEALNYRQQAAMSRAEAGAAKSAGRMSLLSSLFDLGGTDLFAKSNISGAKKTNPRPRRNPIYIGA